MNMMPLNICLANILHENKNRGIILKILIDIDAHDHMVVSASNPHRRMKMYHHHTLITFSKGY